MDDNEVERIEQFSGFKREHLPFRYLGVTIIPKKLNAAECDLLIDKMTSRIGSWCTRSLSYAGRAQLINSVLMSVHTYWAQIFLLPNAVLRKINTICRHYLWSGGANGNKMGNIKWEALCRNKKVGGGMGFRNITLWNKATVGKLVWHIGCQKNDMWVKWVHTIYVKERNWWEFQAPRGASWVIKYLCKVKDGLTQMDMANWSLNHVYSIKKIYTDM